MALLTAHVYSVTHALCTRSFSTLCLVHNVRKMFRTKTGRKLSIPAVKIGRKSLSLSGVRGGDRGYL